MHSKISIEELKKFRYPNLIAEIIESGYSINTLAVYMGLPGSRKENDPEMLAKLYGNMEITVDEAERLAGLFRARIGYLFSHDLETISGKPMAYWRWLHENQRKLSELREIQEIEKILEKKPYLFKFVKLAGSLDKDQIQQLTNLAKKMRNGSIE